MSAAIDAASSIVDVSQSCSALYQNSMIPAVPINGGGGEGKSVGNKRPYPGDVDVYTAQDMASMSLQGGSAGGLAGGWAGGLQNLAFLG